MAGSTAPSRSETTRSSLLEAAERLIDTHGPDAVTVAAITKAAGQRNSAAIHYHFGGRGGLLDAVITEHQLLIDDQRETAMEAMPPGHTWSVLELVALIIDPLVERLDSPGGRAFLQILADRFVNSGDVSQHMASSMQTIGGLLIDLVPGAEPEVRIERARLATSMITVRLGQAATAKAQPHATALRETLVGAVVAVLMTSP